VGVGGATALLMTVSGWLYGHFKLAGFEAMTLLSVAAFPLALLPSLSSGPCIARFHANASMPVEALL
jgi:hypothetical protein